MKDVLLFVWQLPQNLLGLIVLKVTGAKIRRLKYNGVDLVFYFTLKRNFGVSLGKYIIIGGWYDWNDVLHEYGHQKQSLILSWLYLPVIGFTSAVFNNLWDRFFHKKWEVEKRYQWYYNRFPEKWADKLGGVIRNDY